MNKTRIICAVDLSWRSEGAFNYAVALAKGRPTRLPLGPYEGELRQFLLSEIPFPQQYPPHHHVERKAKRAQQSEHVPALWRRPF